MIARFKTYKDLGEKAMAQLNDEQLHFRFDPESNSIAQIIQHMHGNMLSRWTNFLTEDGEKEWRRRDEEFEEKDLTRNEILAMWDEGWKCLFDALSSLKEEDYQKTIYIRKEPLTVGDAIHRQLAHYPYHVGQIVYIAKALRSSKWSSLSIAKGQSKQYNEGNQVKDPAKNF